MAKLSFRLLTQVVVLVASLQSVFGSSWSYDDNDEDGPSSWYLTYSDCAESSQSPIDITDATYDETLGEITFTGYGSADTGTTYTLTNNGHSAKVTFDSGTSMTISGGGLGGTYKLAQFHLHWGSTSSQGSEHTVDGTHYAAELHLVHYNTIYNSIDAAADETNGLAVLGVLISESSSSNSAFEVVTDELSNVEYESSSDVTLTPFALYDILPTDTDKYYRYNGSLTTPPCYESVIWTVFRDPVTLSTAQLESLRALKFEDNSTALEDNYRPVLSLNGRTIWSTFDSSGASSIHWACAAMTSLFATAIAFQTWV